MLRGALFVCNHCGLKMFFEDRGPLGGAGTGAMSNAFADGWKSVDTADQKLELCKTCYGDYQAMVKSFKINTTYYAPNRDNHKVFQIRKERDTDGSEQPAQEQPTLEPADTAAESAALAEAIRDAGGDRCQGL